MAAVWPFIWTLLRSAFKQLLISLITERLLKDIVIVALEKLAKRTDTKIDDDTVLLIKRSLYPDFEAGQPPSLEQLTVAAKKIEDRSEK